MNFLKKAKAYLGTPNISENALVQQKAILLNLLLWLTLFLVVFYTPILYFIIPRSEFTIVFNLFLCGSVIIALFIFHRGQLRLPSIILTAALWIYISSIMFFLGGVRNPVVLSYVFLIMVAGLLLEKRGIYLFTILSLFSVTLIWQLEEYGRLPASLITITDIYYWSSVVIVILACASVLYIGITNLNNALRQAHRNENELAELIEKRTRDLSTTNTALFAEIDNHKQTTAALQQVKEELEQRVDERTNELQKINDSLQIEVHERHRAEKEKQALIAELKAKNHELEQFAYTVSHDLKSPLITIRGFLNFLEQDIKAGKTERAPADIQRILSATDKMQTLLDNLLELSRIGRITNPPTAVSLHAVVTEAVELLNGPLMKHHVIVTLPSTMPDVFVDSARLVEVFQNLISNGIKFMGDQPEPLIEIDISEETETEATCFVRDNGIGIDPRFQDQVFGLFERLDNEVDGTGIGLALVQRIVEGHNGRICVESEGIGHGTTFFVTLPKPNQMDHE